MSYESLFVDVTVSIGMFVELDSISVSYSVDKIPEFLTEFILGSVLNIFESFISDEYSVISVVLIIEFEMNLI